ncbi:MAG: glycosyltransferase [Lachnospiraceae bacterium]|nr:glycosyltransferase [Lachnospiraceae bacterium]
MLKFSVIVPVYNVKKYLCSCIDSILNQNIPPEEYEIILSDDGSTDGSREICEEYKGRFSNIILLVQEHMGVSEARNRGLKTAGGKYIIFVDSDDYIQKDAFSVIFQEMEKGELDVLAVNSDKRTAKNELVSVLKPKNFKEGRVIDGTAYISENGFGVPAMVWHYVYQREFLVREKLVFVSGMFHEDQEWIAHWFPICNRIGYLDMVFYHYRLSEVSIMRSRNLKKCLDLLKVSGMAHDYAEENKKKGELAVYHVLQRYAGSLAWGSLRSCVGQGFKLEQLIVSEEIRQRILKYGYPDKKHGFFFFLIRMKAYRLAEILIKLVVILKEKMK